MCRHPRLQADHNQNSGEFALPDAPQQYAPDLELEPTHLGIDLRLDFDHASAAGTLNITVIARSPGARRLVLDAVDLQSVTVSSSHALTSSYDGTALTITLDTPAEAGEVRIITVHWRVEQPIAGMYFGGPVASSPQRGRYMVTDHETERARYWLPCIDHPSVRTTLDIAITAPTGMEILATGALTATEDHSDGTTTVRWHSNDRCPSYLICLAVGEFVRCDDGAFNGAPVSYFGLPPFTKADLSRTFGKTREMMAFLTERLGQPMPWPKYFQFAAPGIGGAMENISLVSWDDAWIADERLRAERGHVLDQVNVHEMAHTWFGDLVVIRDFSHVWLKESWATYMESVWYEHKFGETALHRQLLTERREYLSEAEGRYTRPIVTRSYDATWSMFDRHLYPGGALRLHLLRTELGDEVFWPAVRDYLDRHARGVVETDDFRRVMEERSGRYLARFFEQWLESPGFPILKASTAFTDGALSVTIEQTQANKKKGIGLFDFSLDVAVETAEGQWVRQTMRISQARHTLRIASASRPLQVVIDPEVKVPHRLRFDPGHDMLVRSLSHSPWITGRIHAARALAKSGKRVAVAAIQAAYPLEEQWGVRCEMARALGSCTTRDAALALAHALTVEVEPRAMMPLLEACSRHRCGDLADAIASWIAYGDRPYRAHGQALIALGAQRGEAWIDTLKGALTEGSWGGHVRRGAVIGLGRTFHRKAVAPLLERLTDTAEIPLVRRAAATALASLVRELDRASRRKAMEALIDTLAAPEHAIRLSAISALGLLGDRRALPAIESARGTTAAQFHPNIERAVRKLRRGGSGTEVARLRTQVETLTAQLMKLEHRLQDLEADGKGEA
ncbi:MAG: M1 family aminopeptidase [Myxococcota bacterium]|nr:M1 family aminopeptidase [Myxococcota bacterium]